MVIIIFYFLELLYLWNNFFQTNIEARIFESEGFVEDVIGNETKTCTNQVAKKLIDIDGFFEERKLINEYA